MDRFKRYSSSMAACEMVGAATSGGGAGGAGRAACGARRYWPGAGAASGYTTPNSAAHAALAANLRASFLLGAATQYWHSSTVPGFLAVVGISRQSRTFPDVRVAVDVDSHGEQHVLRPVSLHGQLAVLHVRPHVRQ